MREASCTRRSAQHPPPSTASDASSFHAVSWRALPRMPPGLCALTRCSCPRGPPTLSVHGQRPPGLSPPRSPRRPQKPHPSLHGAGPSAQSCARPPSCYPAGRPGPGRALETTVSPACRQEAGNAGGQEPGLDGWVGWEWPWTCPACPGLPPKGAVPLFTFREKVYFPFLSLSCEIDVFSAFEI